MPDRAARDPHRLLHWAFHLRNLFCTAGRGQENPRTRLSDLSRLVPLACAVYPFTRDVEGDLFTALEQEKHGRAERAKAERIQLWTKRVKETNLLHRTASF